MDPDEVKSPKALDDWVGHVINTSKGEPTFQKLYNPGGCSSFYYFPVFVSGAQGGQCKAHCLPSGCQSVTPNEEDAAIFTQEGWIFFYKGCKKGEDEDAVRKYISEWYTPPWVGVQEKIFPRSRQGCLDEKLLKKLGMTQCVIREMDFLLFYHILLPLYYTYLSIIWEVKWILCYYEIYKRSNLYAYHIGIAGSYSHVLKPVNLPGKFP